MGVTCMEVDTDREKQLERPLKRRCLRDPIETHTSLQNGALESAPQRTDGVDSSEDDEYLNFLETYHDNYGSVPSKAYRYGSSSGSDDLVDPQYKIFFESLRVTRKSYELEVQVDVGTSILLKYDIEDQPHEGLNLEYLKSRTLKNTAETMRSLRNAVGREKDKVVAVRKKENDKEKRIPRNLSGREESLQTIKAAATSKGNCNLDKRNIEAQPADLGCNQAIKQFPGVLCPKVQQAPEHEEETCNESYPALLNSAKDDGNIPEFISDNGKQTTNAATTNKGNCNFDKRKMEARPTNLGSHQAIRQSPRVLRPEFQKAPEHEEDTCNESYLALLNGAKNVSYILESKSDNGKQNTKAAAASKRNCSLDKRTIDAQPANLGSTQATRWSPEVLRPEVQQAPEHEEETWDESYLAILRCAKEDGSIIEFTSANGKKTTNAATTNKGNCNFDKRKMEARPTNLGSNQAIRQSPRVLHPEFQKATEHEEHTCNESYLALLNGAKNVSYILESKSDNGKQNTKAAAASKRNCSLDKRTIDAQPANLGSTWATRWSPKVLHPEVQQAPEHEEETWDESYLAILHCAKEDGSIIEFTSANGKQIRYEEDDEEDDEESSCEVEMLAGEDISKCEEFVTRKLSKDPITVDSKHFADDPGSSSGTVFRKKLMGVLKMPYDVKEHEDLSRRVRHKRQKTVEKVCVKDGISLLHCGSAANHILSCTRILLQNSSWFELIILGI